MKSMDTKFVEAPLSTRRRSGYPFKEPCNSMSLRGWNRLYSERFNDARFGGSTYSTVRFDVTVAAVDFEDEFEVFMCFGEFGDFNGFGEFGGFFDGFDG